MSLDDLLKDSEKSPKWKEQRAKLLRIAIGVSVIVVALILGAIFLSSLKREAAQKPGVLSEEQKLNAEALALLMKFRGQTEELQREVDSLRKVDKVVVVPRRIAMETRQPAKSVESERIISFDPGEGFSEVATQRSNLYIPTGAVFLAQLITPIKTSVQKTFVMAETTNEFRMDMKRRIPKGSRLIGRSRLDPVLKGVIVEFETLVLPRGIETRLSGLALSRNALPEIDGLYFSDDLQTYGTALAFGFLSGFADAARERQITPFGSQAEVSLSNQVLSGLSTASFQIAEEILRDIRTSAIEYVVVPAGERIFVALTSRYEMDQGRAN